MLTFSLLDLTELMLARGRQVTARLGLLPTTHKTAPMAPVRTIGGRGTVGAADLVPTIQLLLLGAAAPAAPSSGQFVAGRALQHAALTCSPVDMMLAALLGVHAAPDAHAPLRALSSKFGNALVLYYAALCAEAWTRYVATSNMLIQCLNRYNAAGGTDLFEARIFTKSTRSSLTGHIDARQFSIMFLLEMTRGLVSRIDRHVLIDMDPLLVAFCPLDGDAYERCRVVEPRGVVLRDVLHAADQLCSRAASERPLSFAASALCPRALSPLAAAAALRAAPVPALFHWPTASAHIVYAHLRHRLDAAALAAPAYVNVYRACTPPFELAAVPAPAPLIPGGALWSLVYVVGPLSAPAGLAAFDDAWRAERTRDAATVVRAARAARALLWTASGDHPSPPAEPTTAVATGAATTAAAAGAVPTEPRTYMHTDVALLDDDDGW